MKNYLAVVDQENPGCDYTIDCGITVLYTEADNYQAAFQQFVHQLGWQDYVNRPEEYTSNPLRGEQEIMSLCIYELAGNDGGKLYKEFMEKADEVSDASKAAEQQAKDEAEFERLANKLGR